MYIIIQSLVRSGLTDPAEGEKVKVPLERQVGPPECQLSAKLGLPRVEWGLPRAGLALPRANFGRLRTKLGCKRAFRAPTWRLSALQVAARALKTLEKCCTVVKFRGSGCFAVQVLMEPSWTPLGRQLGCSWGLLGANLGLLGANLDALGANWRPTWTLLGPTWALWGPTRALLGLTWTLLGRTWALSGPTWALLGSTWTLLGQISAHLGPSLTPLEWH